MVPDWRTNQVFFSEQFPARYPTLWQALREILRRHSIPFHLVAGTNDIWVRDFLPVQVREGRFAKLRYQPDYLRGFPDLVTGNEVLAHLPQLGECPMSELVVDGGNLVGSQKIVILTDKVFRENPSHSPATIVSALRTLLEVEQLIVIPADPYDEIGHADGVLRFLDEDTVAVNDYSAVNPDYGRQLSDVLGRHGVRIEELPHFVENHEQDGISSAVGNYVNFLRVQDLVIVAAYGRAEDAELAQRLTDLLPGTAIVPLPCLELAREGGVLNCVSWTVRL